ncbi:MAG: 50S ribosomal protein L25 [Myxococcota bacterium]
MQRLELDVDVREGRGKGPARRLRAQGAVPAILYGGGVDSLPLAIESRSLERVLRSGTNALIDLKGAKQVKGKLVLVKDVQRDPVSQKLVHCDLYAVDTAKKLHVEIPVHVEGRAPGVELGGILNLLAREVEVSCLPLAIPDNITVDVSDLGVGDTLRLSDVELPEGVEAVGEANLALVTVTAPRIEEEEVAVGEEAAEAEAAPPAEGAEPAGEAGSSSDGGAEKSG